MGTHLLVHAANTSFLTFPPSPQSSSFVLPAAQKARAPLAEGLEHVKERIEEVRRAAEAIAPPLVEQLRAAEADLRQQIEMAQARNSTVSSLSPLLPFLLRCSPPPSAPAPCWSALRFAVRRLFPSVGQFVFWTFGAVHR